MLSENGTKLVFWNVHYQCSWVSVISKWSDCLLLRCLQVLSAWLLPTPVPPPPKKKTNKQKNPTKTKQNKNKTKQKRNNNNNKSYISCSAYLAKQVIVHDVCSLFSLLPSFLYRILSVHSFGRLVDVSLQRTENCPLPEISEGYVPV